VIGGDSMTEQALRKPHHRRRRGGNTAQICLTEEGP
jgi:hypothetical protein